MENRKAESFKRLTTSASALQTSTGPSPSYAAHRAKILLGCYRTGDANDPETYVAAIAAILARYPEDVVTSVTHPATGLPSRSNWLPTVKEVVEACDEASRPARENAARLKRIKEQMEMREREVSGERPTAEQLRARHGENWGLTVVDRKSPPVKAPTWDAIAATYSADPSRMQRLMELSRHIDAGFSPSTAEEDC